MQRTFTAQIKVTEQEMAQVPSVKEIETRLWDDIGAQVEKLHFLEVGNHADCTFGHKWIGDDLLRNTITCYLTARFDLKVKPHLKKKRRVSWVKAKAV